MRKLNYYVISAALGGTIGERIGIATGPQTYKRIAKRMAKSMRERDPFLGMLSDRGSASSRFIERLRSALEATRNGFSPDRVIADPALNQSFIERCRVFGLENDPFTLNRSLLQLRKAGELSGLNSKRTIVRDQWRFAYASEIAGRAVCLRYGVSIDTMLCHPILVAKFDALATRLAPGTGAFECRWCALNIRKRGLSELDKARRIIKRLRWSSTDLLQALRDVPEQPGICELFEQDRLILVCESGNLLESAELHRGLIDRTLLEPGLWDPSSQSLRWRFSVAGSTGTPTPSIVSALVGRFAPVFNIPRARGTRAA